MPESASHSEIKRRRNLFGQRNQKCGRSAAEATGSVRITDSEAVFATANDNSTAD
jgi:hypothetical protein